MNTIKIFNVEIEGIDKCGKDTICDYLKQIDVSEYVFKSRGLISQIAYSKLYNRDITFYVDEGYISNTLFVLLDVDEEDWKIRCKLTNEPNMGHSFSKSSKIFNDVFSDLKKKYPQYNSHFIKINSSMFTPYSISNQIRQELNNLNVIYGMKILRQKSMKLS